MKFRGTKGLMTTLQGYIQEAKQTKTEETEGFAEIKNEPLA
jgi:hypothetical protein